MSKITHLVTPSDLAEHARLSKELAAGKIELEALQQEHRKLKAEQQQLEATEKLLHLQLNAILKAGGILLEDLPNQPKTRRFDAGRAYVEAVEAGDKPRANFLFKNHKAEIFAFASRH
jgi:hypothetical protein